ncbi:hypothetical protein [Hydrogenimonas sp. SS33]|uniref:hypothetical protein n=1 Tax=Hydrogenimonas leucolamina TaxID=2954236 RepID=UPI00336BBB6C
MAKIRLKKKKVRYATVSRKLLSNPKISLRAKGLGAWLELHQDGFELNFEFILQNMKEGRDTLRKALKELREEDFLITVQTRNQSGKFETIWVFDSEGAVSRDVLPTTEMPEAEKPEAVIPEAAKPTQIIKENKRKDKKEKTLSKNTDFLKSQESFVNYMREAFTNQTIALTNSKYTGQLLEIGISSDGMLYDRRTGKTFPGTRAKEIWSGLYDLASKGKLPIDFLNQQKGEKS